MFEANYRPLTDTGEYKPVLDILHDSLDITIRFYEVFEGADIRLLYVEEKDREGWVVMKHPITTDKYGVMSASSTWREVAFVPERLMEKQ